MSKREAFILEHNQNKQVIKAVPNAEARQAIAERLWELMPVITKILTKENKTK